ncbi:unnamed protein product [Amoebophrya sp. A25]|nr:unnamed protein product [Amoebophrya sp. A25]|eukprot:GSA25T00026059001.1
MSSGDITYTHGKAGQPANLRREGVNSLIEIPGNDEAFEGAVYYKSQGKKIAITSVRQFYMDVKTKRISLSKNSIFEAALASNGKVVRAELDTIHPACELCDRGKDCWVQLAHGSKYEYVAGECKELRTADQAAADMGNVNNTNRGRNQGSVSESGPENYVYFDEVYLLDGQRRSKALPATSGWYPARRVFRRVTLLDMLQRETKMCPLTRILMEAPNTDLNGYSKHTGPIFYTKDPMPHLLKVQKQVREIMRGLIPHDSIMAEGEAEEILAEAGCDDEGTEVQENDIGYYENLHAGRRVTQKVLYDEVSKQHQHGHAEEVSLRNVHKVKAKDETVRSTLMQHKKEMHAHVHRRHEASGAGGGEDEADDEDDAERRASVAAAAPDEVAPGQIVVDVAGEGEHSVELPTVSECEDEENSHSTYLSANSAFVDRSFMEGSHFAERESFTEGDARKEALLFSAIVAKQHYKAKSRQAQMDAQRQVADSRAIDQVTKALHVTSNEVKQLVYEGEAGMFIDLTFDAGYDTRVVCSDCDPDGDNGYSRVAAATEWRRPWVGANAKYGEFEEFLIAPDGVHETDIRQHNVGDCWLTSILAAASYREDPHFVMRTVTHAPEYGIFTFKITVEGQTRWLLLDDRIPVEKGNMSNPKFVSSATQGELWPVLVEKAFAKWAGCYQNLRGGMQNIITPIGSTKAMEALTSGSEIYEVETSKRHFNPNNQIIEPQLTIPMLLDFRRRNFLMTTSGCDGKDGLIPGHVFSVLDVLEIPLADGKRQYQRFLQEFASQPVTQDERESEKVLHLVNETGVAVRFRHYSEEAPTKWRGTVLQRTMKSYDFKLEGNHGKLKWCYETPDSAKNFQPEEILAVRNGDTISFKQPNQVQGSQVRKKAGHAETAKVYEKCPAGQMWLTKPSKTIKFMKIRNPWGHGEWTGLWADASPVWQWYPELAKQLHFVKSDDGVFFMQWEDFDWAFGASTVCGHVEGSPLAMWTYEHRKDYQKSAAKRSDLSYSRSHFASHRMAKEDEAVEGDFIAGDTSKTEWKPTEADYARALEASEESATMPAAPKKGGNGEQGKCGCTIM